MGFGGSGIGRDFLQTFFIKGACATPFHLLKIIATFDISHKQQTLKRTHVGACGYHIHGDGNSGVITVAKVGEQGFGGFAVFDDIAIGIKLVILGFIGDFFAKLIALAKLFSHDMDNIIGVAVIFGKNQRLWHVFTIGKNHRQTVFKGADNGANLAGIDHVII